MAIKQQLPNSTTVLVLGICSIVFAGCFGIGTILGIIGLVLASKGRKLNAENPELYDGYGSLNAGFIMSIIGIVLGALGFLYWIIVVVVIGSSPFWAASHHYSY